MNSKNFRPYHFIPMALLFGVVWLFRETPEKEPTRAPTSVPKQNRIHRPPQFNKVFRAPASVKPQRFDLDRVVVSRNSVKLPRGNMLTDNIGARAMTEWKPGEPAPLLSDGVYGYYVKKNGENSIPVAYNPVQKKFYPVSSVVHIRGVDEKLRLELKNEGLQEYIYFKNIQKLSLKTEPGNVVSLYETLRNKGLNVKLEVLQHRYRAQ